MAGNSFVQVPPDSTGKQVATNLIGGKEYQAVHLADADGDTVTPASDTTLQALHEAADTLLLVAQTLLRTQSRMDVTGRIMVNGSEVAQPVSGTVTATVANATVTNMTQISGQTLPYIGFDRPAHIYDNIKVT
jgi:hypothetical protein